MPKTGDLYRDVFLQLSIGCMIVERKNAGELILIDINDMGYRMVNMRTLKREEMLGKNMLELFDNLVESGLLANYNKVLDSGEALGLGAFEYEDSEVPHSTFEVNLLPLDSLHLLITYNNITARAAAEAKEQQNTKELLRANEELQRFNRLAVDRENAMIQLKREVNRLCVELDQDPVHALEFMPEEDRVG